MTVNEQDSPVLQTDDSTEKPGRARGQALVEYAIIASLVVVGIIAILTITGPTVGNIFSNTVYNLLGQTFNAAPMPNDQTILTQAKSLETLTPPSYQYNTNTPLIPTCASNHLWAPANAQGTWLPADTTQC